VDGSTGRDGGERLVVAQVRGLRGLRGAVRVESLTDRPEKRFAPGRLLFVEGAVEPLTIAEAGPDGPGWRLRFEEVADRSAAEALREAYLEAVVAADDRPAEGEFYWHEIVGAAVVDTDGRALGLVTDVYRAGGAEVALVSGDTGEMDVPLVKAVVRNLDVRKGEMVVDAEALGLRDGAGEPAEAQ